MPELRGFQSGADDYIRKPFSQRVLIERIKTLLPRRGWITDRDLVNAKSSAIHHLYVDSERHGCIWKGQVITLTEFLILQFLASRPGVVKSRDALAAAMHDTGAPVDPPSVDSHIKRLRRKFRAVDDRCEVIETLFGVGYRLSETHSLDSTEVIAPVHRMQGVS
jgi:two-component system, OmpR family, response regulator ChvI